MVRAGCSREMLEMFVEGGVVSGFGGSGSDELI